MRTISAHGLAPTVAHQAQHSPHAIAVFLQAYSLGRSVDDVSAVHVDNAQWQRVVAAAIDSFQS